MKKIVVFIAVIISVFCFCGCAGSVNDESANSSQLTPPSGDIEQGGSEGGETDDENTAEEIDMITVSCGENTLEIELADTVSARDFAGRLSEGDITIFMRGYGGFEMVGGLGFSLEREDEQMTTSTGDVVLYSGNQIVIFYDSNSWAYTKIGHINGATRQSLENFFGTTGEVEVSFSVK